MYYALKTVRPKATGVRIPHPKIEELALQAQGVGIFVIDEYPSSKPFDKLEFVY